MLHIWGFPEIGINNLCWGTTICGNPHIWNPKKNNTYGMVSIMNMVHHLDTICVNNSNGSFLHPNMSTSNPQSEVGNDTEQKTYNHCNVIPIQDSTSSTGTNIETRWTWVSSGWNSTVEMEFSWVIGLPPSHHPFSWDFHKNHLFGSSPIDGPPQI